MRQDRTATVRAMPLDEHRAANLASWDERVAIHAASRLYGVDRFLADPQALSGVVSFDAPRVGDVRGKSLLHLQCHFGLDTLSWARLGANVTGLDFSSVALDQARRLSEAGGLPARFVQAEIYDAPDVLPETFDIVYTGVGALNWLPDVRRWAQVVAAFLEPGGRFYIREGHPVLFTVDDERDDDLLVITYPYWETQQPLRWDYGQTYTDGDATLVNSVTYEWNHGLAEVLQALIDAGLHITATSEYDTAEWKALPNMVEDADGRYRLPSGGERLPLMYSVSAVKPMSTSG
jgi:SAM-dependent methyltransferase